MLVLRSSGEYSRGRIDGADAASGTCTVRMDDGRLKYLVEMDDLRHFRAGAFHTGDIVSHEATGMAAAVAEFDEDSDTYTLLLRTGQRLFYVTEGEIGKKLPGW